jgi:hypothetical protein
MDGKADSLRRWAPWVTIVGVVVLLLGLAWDAVLHRIDPTLAEREGVFTLSNPGHVLFGGGIVIIVVGALMYLAGGAYRSTRRAAFAIVGVGLIALASTSFALAASTGTLTGAHHHDETAAATDTHDHSASSDNPANSKLPGVTHDHGEATAITTAQLQAAEKLVEDTRAGTQRFQDINVAIQEGYRLLAGARDGLAHYHNQAYHSDGNVLDPEHPEDLIYLRYPNGGARLVGVMYLMPSPDQPGPRIGGPLTAWHAHDNLCISPLLGRITAFTDANGKCPAGTVWMGKTPEMMHVWLVDNPNGVFSDDMNPAALVQLLNAEATR